MWQVSRLLWGHSGNDPVDINAEEEESPFYQDGCPNRGCRLPRGYVMNEQTERPIAERVRTVLARGAAGTVGAGLLRRPLRSARVRDDGVIVLVVDVGGMSRESGGDRMGVVAGASASIEIVDAVCTGRCSRSGARPSFAIDGRATASEANCGEGCAVARGVVSISGIVTTSSPARRRRLVSAEGGGLSSAEASSLWMGELQPLEVSYLSADGAYLVPRGELATAVVDPVGVDEQAWLRRFAADTELAACLALRSGRQIAGTDPWVIGIDQRGLELSLGSVTGAFREVVRLPFAQVCATAEDVEREVATLAGRE